jgi:lanosterol synthase
MVTQQENGDWPEQDPAGVFFHTAPLDYTLYRSYFPIWALGLYESHRLEQLSALGGLRREDTRVPAP